MKCTAGIGSGARAVSVGFLMAVAVLVVPGAAFAAGTGYTPGGPTNGGPATGLPGNVVATTTIQPSGGTANATIGDSTVSVTVPAGAFTGPVQLVVTDASTSSVTPPEGTSTVVTFGIGFFVNGTKVTATFPAVAVTISSPSITAGSTVYLVTGSTLQSVSGAAVKNGSASFTITSDPVAEVASPVAAAATAAATGSGSPIAGATSTETGQPFFIESLAAAGLIVFGSLILVVLRLRRRTT